MSSKANPLIKESVAFHRRALEAELRVSRERLQVFEKEHGFSSAAFVKRFEGGKLGDDREWFDWLAEVEAAKALERKLAALRGLP